MRRLAMKGRVRATLIVAVGKTRRLPAESVRAK